MLQKDQKMAVIKKKTKITMQSAGVSLLLLGFQVLMGVKFACPCRFWWNQGVALLIVTVPAFFAGLMMHLFLRFQKQNNSELSEGQDNTGISKSGKKLHCMIRFIPSLLWVCVFLIDGDYLACGLTSWNGQYSCDTDVHPNCVSWCKPESNQGTDETGKYIYTQFTINISKSLGYGLALLSCSILCIILYMSKGNNRSGTSVSRQQRPEEVVETETIALQVPQSV
ncbi:hypothetical protein R3I93_017079 [Phoxinus phoxinus]|uniref:Uncharacterized protein n=1 Tax=Phoxinus phoxinus TaxID=58324 RepID=A0AAN9CJC0_9TELE